MTFVGAKTATLPDAVPSNIGQFYTIYNNSSAVGGAGGNITVAVTGGSGDSFGAGSVTIQPQESARFENAYANKWIISN